MQASRATLLVVAAAGLVAIGAAVRLPLTSPFGLAEGDTPPTIALYGIAGLLWLAAIIVTLARQPANPLWKLMLAYLVVDRLIWALQFVSYPVVQGLASSSWGISPEWRLSGLKPLRQ